LAPLLLAAAQSTPGPLAPNRKALSPPPPNILLVVLDDIGIDALGLYGLDPNAAPTPNIDALAAGGLMFRAAYSNPVCSPTRAAMQTGRYGFRTGIGDSVTTFTEALSPSEVIIPKMLDLGRSGFAHAAFGKWHLSNDSTGGVIAPNLLGYDHFAGVLYNFGGGTKENYFTWIKVVDGLRFTTTGYLTTDTVDDAVAWIHQAPPPWFCYVAFNSAHAPLHAPPAHLHSYVLPNSEPQPGEDPRPYFRAMIQALDTELGRLLASAGGNTTVILAGDNGTASTVISPPFDQDSAKGTVYEGGIRVPLVVHGPPVAAPGAQVDAPVSAVDVFATVAELGGVDLGSLVLPTLDSISFAPYFTDPMHPPLREFVFAERFSPNGMPDMPTEWHRSLRNAGYKLIERTSKPLKEFFDLQADPYEQAPLETGALDPVQQANYDALVAELFALLAS
jgi:arylsulfatase A-like enzyme